MLFLSAVAKVLPVFLLILLGVLLRRVRFLQPATIGDFRSMVVNVALPSALFLAFSTVSINWNYLLIVAVFFVACLVVLLLGKPLGRLVGVHSAYFPSLITGFEAGMMGYAIYGAVYGADAIYKFGIVDLGQVLFVFFILVPGLQRMSTGPQSFTQTLVGFLKTPVILAIVGGLLFNQLGLTRLFSSNALLDGVLQAVRLVGAMTTPLVTLIIGYGLQFRQGALRRPLITQAVRMLLWIPFGYLFARLVVGGLLGLDTAFQAALFTMVLLPGPFVIPIFMRNEGEEETDYVVNSLTLGTVVTLVLYAVVPVIFPPV